MLIQDASRRRFLQRTLGGIGALGIGTLGTGSHGAGGGQVHAGVPQCFADASEMPGGSQPGGDRVLVVLQLSGGNDGLNTVVPLADDEYQKARPKLAIDRRAVLAVDDQTGFHPSLSGARELFDDGKMTIVRGVGYDDPNRSHFESMDIWHTCRRKQEVRPDGWLGRYLDTVDLPVGGDVPAMHLGREPQPLAMSSQSVRVPTIRDLDEFRLRGTHRESLRKLLAASKSNAGVQTIAGGQTNTSAAANDLLRFVQSSTDAALAASERVREAATQYRTGTKYPETTLGKKLRVVAQLIDAGLSTRVFYVQLDGFDTHSQQSAAHAALLREWSDAVTAFVKDLQTHDHGQRVCVMTFSEFGRRVAENASQGTDHGAAGPMFLCGGGLRGGLMGLRPDLNQLNNGDVQHTIDFRQVYATVLRDWLGLPPEPILGRPYDTLKLFA
ncbi:MAG: DUF1501 domain-containing protein [Planctomycetota bacterium]